MTPNTACILQIMPTLSPPGLLLTKCHPLPTGVCHHGVGTGGFTAKCGQVRKCPPGSLACVPILTPRLRCTCHPQAHSTSKPLPQRSQQEAALAPSLPPDYAPPRTPLPRLALSSAPLCAAGAVGGLLEVRASPAATVAVPVAGLYCDQGGALGAGSGGKRNE